MQFRPIARPQNQFPAQGGDSPRGNLAGSVPGPLANPVASLFARALAGTAMVALAALLAGCGGGGATVASSAFGCTSGEAGAFCLTDCSIGCSSTGCLRTDVAQNEILILQFSANIDPASVSTSTVQLRTASGELPVGQFLVNGNQIEFLPTLLISGNQSFFGFRPGETYTLTIPGGRDASQKLRTTSGRTFTQTFSCTLQATLGIRDHNGVPPSATLVSPSQSQLGGAPLNTIIQLDFNEMVDATPFLAAGGGSGPVTFTLRRTRPAGAGGRECDSASLPVVLPGTARLDFDPSRGVSVLTFRSNTDLPANACIEINVTSQVTDISGRPAQPQTFQFLTATVPLVDRAITEEFDDAQMLDREFSAGTWSGGQATFGQIGGDGVHGSFSLALATDLGTVVSGTRTLRLLQLNADSTIIPAANTRTGSPIAVTDGRFFFDRMVLPSDVRLRIVGNSPPQFTVSGRLDIQGEIDVAGGSLTTVPTNAEPVGQMGAPGGVFGGAGGQGGNRCSGTGYLQAFDGRNGSNARVLGNRAYQTSVAGSGGLGSLMFPRNGLNTSVFYHIPNGLSYTPTAAAGGGGGGLRFQGGQGRVVSNNHIDPLLGVPPRLDVMGPPADGGSAVQFFPFPAGTGSDKSSVHFLVGGAGGGGAGSQPTLNIGFIQINAFAPGGGGGGGGGAVSLRAGDSLTVGPLGRVLANGGSAANSPAGTASAGQASMGGGGSGGSVVLQAGRVAEINGIVDVRGGNGGSFNRSAATPAAPSGATVVIAGGAGSPGFVRCEVPGTPSVGLLANMLPAATTDNVGPLTETDDLVMFQSNWYTTGQPFGPDYARYVIEATVDGVPMVFSDDPTVSTMPAQSPQPIRAFFQNANLDLLTGLPAPLLGQTEPTIRPWRTAVRSSGPEIGIASDGLNGFRFALILDRAIATNVTVQRVRVVYRT
jgi:hypothetical protein